MFEQTLFFFPVNPLICVILIQTNPMALALIGNLIKEEGNEQQHQPVMLKERAIYE